MNRLKPILWIVVPISITAMLLLAWKLVGGTIPVQAVDDSDKPSVIVKEAIAHGQEHRLALPENEAEGAAMVLPESKPAKQFAYLAETEIIDPVSIGLGIKPDIPYTYISDIGKSAAYVATMAEDGWTRVGTFRTPEYVDVYLAKDGVICRIITLQGYLKVLYPIRSGVPDPESFING